MEPVLPAEVRPELIVGNVASAVSCLMPVLVSPHLLAIVHPPVVFLPVIHLPVIVSPIIDRTLFVLLISHISILLLLGPFVFLFLIFLLSLLLLLLGLIVLPCPVVLLRSVLLLCSVVGPRRFLIVLFRRFLSLGFILVPLVLRICSRRRHHEQKQGGDAGNSKCSHPNLH